MIGCVIGHQFRRFPFEELARDSQTGSFDEDVKHGSDGQRDYQVAAERVKLKIKIDLHIVNELPTD